MSDKSVTIELKPLWIVDIAIATVNIIETVGALLSSTESPNGGYETKWAYYEENGTLSVSYFYPNSLEFYLNKADALEAAEIARLTLIQQAERNIDSYKEAIKNVEEDIAKLKELKF